MSKDTDKYEWVMVCMDSNHTHDHVLAELEAYGLVGFFATLLSVFAVLDMGLSSTNSGVI